MIIIAKLLYLDQATAGHALAHKREIRLTQEEWRAIGETGKHQNRVIREMQVVEFQVQ